MLTRSRYSINVIVFLLAAAWLAGCTTHINERSFIRPVSAEALMPEQVKGLPEGYQFSSDHLPTSDGERLYRVRFTHPQAHSTLLFYGGNLSTIGKGGVPLVQSLAAAWNANFVLVDYRGYGQSSGEPSLARMKSDALQIFDDEARRAEANGKKLIVAGFSLGGMVAGSILEQRSPDGAILLATATTVEEFMNVAIPWYMKIFFDMQVDPALRAIDNLTAVRTFKGPLLVVGAAKDSQVPPVLSERLFKAAATPADKKQLAIVQGADHNDLIDTPGLRAALKNFAAAHQF
jgi:uncharacterized protein